LVFFEAKRAFLAAARLLIRDFFCICIPHVEFGFFEPQPGRSNRTLRTNSSPGGSEASRNVESIAWSRSSACTDEKFTRTTAERLKIFAQGLIFNFCQGSNSVLAA
jgi:hypothetical protein